jgi:ATP-dependent Clp protease ATP-binding subunit ClpA
MPYLTDMYHEQNRTARNGAAPASPRRFDASALTATLQSRIVGQPDAIRAVVRAVSIAHAGVADPDRPLASLLLVGPTGVGKTELVRRVAAEIRSGPEDLCRIDMAALAQEHYAASFSGAPPGYAGSKESFTLFDRDKVEGDPYTPGIVLLDEIEKADPTVIRALLHILDRGQLRLANGRETINFRNALIFMTSNLGSREVAEARRGGRPWRQRRAAAAGSPTADHALIQKAVERFFDPEFFNRIDETVVLGAFDSITARRVVGVEVDALIRQLRRASVDLHVHEDVIDRLHDMGLDPVYGARGLRRTIRTHLVAPVADCILRERSSSVDHLDLRAFLGPDGGLTVSPGRDQ